MINGENGVSHFEIAFRIAFFKYYISNSNLHRFYNQNLLCFREIKAKLNPKLKNFLHGFLAMTTKRLISQPNSNQPLTFSREEIIFSHVPSEIIQNSAKRDSQPSNRGVSSGKHVRRFQDANSCRHSHVNAHAYMSRRSR